MVTTQLRYGIPDVDLPLRCGGTVNPSGFAGHQLVVLFLPDEPAQQITEFDTYEKLSGELSGTDAWFLAIAGAPCLEGDSRLRMALDPQEKAWRAFKEVAGDANLDRSAGAAFFFTRGGAFHRVWPGSGRADEILQELLSRG